jgi:hypothetical protein
MHVSLAMSADEIEPRNRRWKNALACLSQKASYKGLGANSEGKHDPVSDIDNAEANSLKIQLAD